VASATIDDEVVLWTCSNAFKLLFDDAVARPGKMGNIYTIPATDTPFFECLSPKSAT
jgi:hypothetical protein